MCRHIVSTNSDGSPGGTYTYDWLGWQSMTAWNGLTDTLFCNPASQFLSESYSGGTLVATIGPVPA